MRLRRRNAISVQSGKEKKYGRYNNGLCGILAIVVNTTD
jgi:hypothetical protein